MLSVLKDCTTSGALPPRIAAMILSSLIPPTLLTVIHGYLRVEVRQRRVDHAELALGEAVPDGDLTGLRDWAPVGAEPVVLDPPLLPPPQAASASVPSRTRVKALRLTGTSLRAPDPGTRLVSKLYRTRP